MAKANEGVEHGAGPDGVEPDAGSDRPSPGHDAEAVKVTIESIEAPALTAEASEGARREPPIIDGEAVEVEPAAATADTASARPREPGTKTAAPVGFGRLVAASLLGAGLAMAAAWVFVGPARKVDADELRARIAGVEARQQGSPPVAASPAGDAGDAGKVDELAARLGKLEAAAGAAGPAAGAAPDAAVGQKLDDLAARLATLEQAGATPPAEVGTDRPGAQKIDDLAARVAKLEAAGTVPGAAVPDGATAQKIDDIAARLAKLEDGGVTPPAAAGPDGSLEKLEKKVDEVASGLARIEAQPPAAPVPDAAVVNRLATLEAALQPLTQRVDDLDRRIQDAAAAAARAGEQSEATASRLLAEVKNAGSGQKQWQQSARAELDGLAGRIEALDEKINATDAKLAKPAATPADRPLRMAVVAVALRTAVERDTPYVPELAAARTLGMNPEALAALEPFAASGVQSPNELVKELSALMPELLRVSAPTAREGSYLDRLQANAVKLMNIRPVGDVPGDDPATVIGRIELKMVRPDIAGVLAELDKLPPPARELAQSWRKKALAREAAVKAARTLATGAFARLDEPTAPDASAR